MRHPSRPSVHPVDGWLRVRGHAAWIDDDVVLICTDRTIAERVVELFDRYGLVDVPDALSDVVVWGPPTGPRQHPLET